MLIPELSCPNCQARMRKVEALPGSKVNCLNCGNKFEPAPEYFNTPAAHSDTATLMESPAGAGAPAEFTQAEAVAPALDTARNTAAALAAVEAPAVVTSQVPARPQAAPPPVPLGREPSSPSYMLLRVITLVIGALTLAGGLIFCLMNLRFFLSSSSILVLCMMLSIPWLFFSLYAICMRGIRMEQVVLRRHWRSGLLSGPLPAPEGSNLPYLGPVAVVGGVLPFLIINSENGNISLGVMMAIVFGMLCLVAGMAAEELRKFFWRMGRLAPRSRSSKGGTVTYGTTELNWSAWFLAGTAGLLGAGWLCMRVYGPEKFYVRYWGSFLVASALTTYFLGLHWHQMVWSWCRRPGILTGLLQMGRWAPLVFIGLMWSFFIYLCVRQGSPPNSDGFIWFFFFGFTLLALGLRTLLGDIVHFMGAWRAFMRQPAPAQPGSVLEREPGAAGGGALASTLIYTGWSLLVAQSASTLLTLLPMLPMIFRSQLLEVLLGFGLYFLGLNTPLFVLLLMVRELLRDDAPGS